MSKLIRRTCHKFADCSGSSWRTRKVVTSEVTGEPKDGRTPPFPWPKSHANHRSSPLKLCGSPVCPVQWQFKLLYKDSFCKIKLGDCFFAPQIASRWALPFRLSMTHRDVTGTPPHCHSWKRIVNIWKRIQFCAHSFLFTHNISL